MPTIDADILCVLCGRSLRGAELDGPCSHCGKPVEASLALHIVNETDLTVRSDVSCVHCGYNLRTLSIGSRCPECGEAVADSLRSDDLRFAPLNWLYTLRTGTTMVALAHLGPIVIAAVIGVRIGSIGAIAALIAGLGTLVLLGLGLIVLNEPRPDRPEVPFFRDRQATMIVLFGTSILLPVFSFAIKSVSLLPLCVAVSVILICVAGIVSLRTIGQLAQRAGDKWLLLSTNLACFLLVLWLLIFVLAAVGFAMEMTPYSFRSLFSGGPQSGRGRPVNRGLPVHIVLTYLVTLIASLRSLRVLSKAIRSQTSATP